MENFVNNEINITLKNILNYFYSKCNNSYIPAIIDEGNLLGYGSELYIKLMAVDKDVKIDKTWYKTNFTIDCLDKCLNIITLLNYNRNKLFTLNPNIVDNDYITMLEPKNDFCANLEYYQDNKIAHNKVLIQDEKNILVYFPAIEDYSGAKKFVPNYDLYIEIEYRTLNNDIFPDRLGKFCTEYGCVDLIYEENDFSKQKGLKQYWLRASVKLDLNKLKLKNESPKYEKIKVYDIGDKQYRTLNLNNYNDDMDAGLIVFSNDIVEILKKYYYFYDLILISKIDGIKDCLIDCLDDCVVFWEGEFNSKIPVEIKEEIEPYNITNRINNIISEPMFDWQLSGKWNYYESLIPNQKLAHFIRNNYFNLAIEKEIDFYPPQNIKEYSEFVKIILDITSLQIENLKIDKSKKELLHDIINVKHIFKDNQEMINNYQGLCSLLMKEIGYEN